MWPPNFVDPVVNKADISEAKNSGEYRKKTMVPVKAAPSTATSSVFFEPDMITFLKAMTAHGQRYPAEEQMIKMFELIKKSQLEKYYKATPERRPHIVTDPADVIRIAIENARPIMALEAVRVAGTNYQVPVPITEHRSLFEARRWLVNAAIDRDRKAMHFYERMAQLILETFNNKGRVIAVKNEHHKLCEQNRAYAHYRRLR